MRTQDARERALGGGEQASACGVWVGGRSDLMPSLACVEPWRCPSSSRSGICPSVSPTSIREGASERGTSGVVSCCFVPVGSLVIQAGTRPLQSIAVRSDRTRIDGTANVRSQGRRFGNWAYGIIWVSFRTEPYKTCLYKKCRTRLALFLNLTCRHRHRRARAKVSVCTTRLHYPRPGFRALTRRPPSADAHAHRALPCPAP